MSLNPKIILADDNYTFTQSIKKGLGVNGFDTTICYDGDAAWKELNKRNSYDICLLNFSLPKISGFELLVKMRYKNTHLPILFLADKTKDENIINAFKHGGDGWMEKPLSIQELVCRIHVFLKRSGHHPIAEGGMFKIGESILNYPERILTDAKGNETAILTKKMAAVLRYLCQKPNTVITREELLYTCWGQVDYFKGRSLDVYITHIRKMFKEDKAVSIDTLHNKGFRFNMPTKEI